MQKSESGQIHSFLLLFSRFSTRGHKESIAMKVTSQSPVAGRGILLILRTVMDIAEGLIPYINNKNPDGPTRTGGVLRVWQRVDEGGPYLEVLMCSIGELGVKLPTYLQFSLEKGERLITHPDHVSSWQSRDEAAEQYGGAIRCGPFVLSFSGLPEAWDETVLLLAAAKLSLTDAAQEYAILTVSANPTFAQFLG